MNQLKNLTPSIISLITYLVSSLFSPQVYAFEQGNESNQFEQALQSFNQKDYDTAYIHLKNADKNSTNQLPSKILLGRIYLENGYYQEAETELTEALALGGDIELVLIFLGEALLMQKKYQQVIKLGENYRLSALNKSHWYLLSAKAFSQLKQPKKELAFYQRALRLSPKNIDVINGLATYYIKSNSSILSQKFLTASFLLDKKNPRTWHLQALLFKQQNKVNKATNALQKALIIDPEFTNAIRTLATIYFDLKDNENALLTINKVLVQSPNDHRAQLLKARLLLAKRDNSEDSQLAQDILNKLTQQISQVPEQVLLDNDWILFINGITAYLLENYESSIRTLLQYQTNHAENFHATLMIAHSYLKIGQRGPAREVLAGNLDKVVENLEAALLLCDLYIENSKAFKCESIIVSLNNAFPNNTKVLLAEARVLYSRKQFDEAITLVEQANDKNYDLQFDNYLIELYMAADQYHKAGRLVTKLLVEHPDNIALLNVMAAALIKINQPKEAYQVLQQVLNLDAQHFAAKYNQASALLDLRQPQQAKQRLLALIEIKPKHIQSQLLLAKTEMALGNSLDAIAVLNRLLQIDKSNIAAREMLVQLFKLTGQYEQALDKLNTLLNSNRLSSSYLLDKVEIFLALGEVIQAKKQIEILKGVWNDDAQGLIMLARIQRRVKDLTGARASINRAFEIAPKLNELAFADAKLSVFEKNTAIAEKKIAQLKGSNVQSSQVVMLEGDLFISKSNIEAAQLNYLKAFELNNNNGMALAKAYNLAIAGFQKDVFEQQLVSTLNEQQSNFYYRNMLADFLLLEQRYAEAKQQYLRIYRLKALPNRADVLNNLAFTSMFDDLDAAENYAQQASELKPTSSAILDTLGWILATKTKFKQALSVLRNASFIDTSDASIRYHLAYTLHHVGRDKEAIVELEYAIQSPQNFAERDAAKKLLDSL